MIRKIHIWGIFVLVLSACTAAPTAEATQTTTPSFTSTVIATMTPSPPSTITPTSTPVLPDTLPTEYAAEITKWGYKTEINGDVLMVDWDGDGVVEESMTKNAEGQWEVTGKFVVAPEGWEQVTAEGMTFEWENVSGVQEGPEWNIIDAVNNGFFFMKFRSTGKVTMEILPDGRQVTYTEAVTLNKQGEEIRLKKVVIGFEMSNGTDSFFERPLRSAQETAMDWPAGKEETYTYYHASDGKRTDEYYAYTSPYIYLYGDFFQKGGFSFDDLFFSEGIPELDL